MKITINTDGASRGNPGPASFGFVISDEMGNIIYQAGEYIGVTTNNVAEYRAVFEALKKTKEIVKNQQDFTIKLLADSKLVAEQLSGNYKVKAPHLKPVVEEIKILSLELGGVIFSHIPREKNIMADKMANQALDKHF